MVFHISLPVNSNNKTSILKVLFKNFFTFILDELSIGGIAQLPAVGFLWTQQQKPS